MLRTTFSHIVAKFLASSRRRRNSSPVVAVEHLEVRSLMYATAGLIHEHGTEHDDETLDVGDDPVILNELGNGVNDIGGVTQPSIKYPLGSLPVLDSNLNATVQLHLDFNGNFEPTWKSYRNVTSPVFSLDDDRTTYSDWELATIQETWAAVAEDFAPFNINVTTVDRGNYTNGQGIRVVIGGSPMDWYGSSAGGVANIGSFTNALENVAYVFSDFKWPRRQMDGIAAAASHEAGHSFGLQHQAEFDAAGRMVNCYRPGDAHSGPIMGSSSASQRSIWSNGRNLANRLQDDMAVLAAARNVGYRPDDHGDNVESATFITSTNGQFTGNGLITRSTDRDVFRFHSDGGTAVITVSNKVLGANLVVQAELRDLNGNTLAAATGGDHDRAYLKANLPTGDYLLIIGSNGEYGSVGAYSFSGSVTFESNLAPQGIIKAVATSRFGSRHELSWSAAIDAVGYRIFRRTAGNVTETLVETLPAGMTQATLVIEGKSDSEWSPTYRVEAFNALGTISSAIISVAHDFQIPTRPGRIEVSNLTGTSVRLTWAPSVGADYQRLVAWRYISDTATVYEKFIIMSPEQTTITLTELTAGQRYAFNIAGITPAGSSGSQVLLTMPHPQAPAAPQSLQAIRLPNRVIELSWSTAAGATQYRIYSYSGNVMRRIGTVTAPITSFRTTSLTYDTDYDFAVEAVNSMGGTHSEFHAVRLTRTPLTAVSNYQVSNITSRSVTLTWDDSVGETGYRLRYRTNIENSAAITLNPNTTSYTFSNLQPGKAYVFSISPFNLDGAIESTLSATTLSNLPTAIRNFTATASGSREVQLSWTDSIGETRYSIYRVNSNNSRQLVANVSANSTGYRVRGLATRTNYRFVIVASNVSGMIESEMVSVTTNG